MHWGSIRHNGEINRKKPINRIIDYMKTNQPVMNDFAREFIEQSAYRLDESSRMIRKCFEELREEDIWSRPNPASNSIGNLILHLCGNITQYAIAALRHIDDQRDRDAEFAARHGSDKTSLLNKLLETVEGAKRVIRQLDEQDLLHVRSVQGFRLSGTGIILHVVEHYSYHTGQIAFWTKIIKEKDLGFYDGLDLNQKNEP